MLVLRLSVLFRPLRVFIPVSATCFILGFAKLVHDIIVAVTIAGETGRSLFSLPVVSSTAVTFPLASLQILLVGMVAEALSRHLKTRSETGPGGDD